MSSNGAAISVRGLTKRYGDFEAVRGIDFEVAQGEVFGLLGPNGAGKTTTVEILEGLRPRTAGEVSVLGFDPGVQVRELKDRIGVSLQSTNLPDKIKVSEALALFAAFYSRSVDRDKLLDRLKLTEKKNVYYSLLSGGQKQRVALALALINDPQILFLDEPTSGLDPQVRLEIHSLIHELKDAKRTILITTHYIEEAEKLCDRVAIIDEGKIIAIGTPREIQAQNLGQTSIEILCDQPVPAERLPGVVLSEKYVIAEDGKRLTVYAAQPARMIVELVKWIDHEGIGLADIHLKRPTLEDVFIELTGEEVARMKAYLAQIAINLKLTLRDKMVLFFNYVFPLIFFFMFAGLFKAERGGAIVQVLTMVLTIGVLGTGFFGAGIRSAQDREQNILRRFKVAPITAAPILISSIVTGLVNFLPSALLLFLLSHFLYGMEFPRRWLSLFLYLCVGVIAFRCLGLIIASVVNSMQESQILVQILYFPMLMLSGATFPLSILPNWLQIVTQFIPSTYLITGMQSILGRDESFWQNLPGAAALMLTSVLAMFISIKIFRWEKDEKLPASAKLWVVASLAPFLILGVYEARTREGLVKNKVLRREQSRDRTHLIRNVRIFVGDGKTIESGGVLLKAGKIEQVYEGATPEASTLKADLIDGSGKTLIPGLIDVHVHLAAPGGFSTARDDMDPEKNIPRELAAYLYSGITAVKSVGDPLDTMLKFRGMVNSGERLGAELFICGPMFTTAGGHGTEYFKQLPDNVRAMVEAQTLRLPKSADEARQQVEELKKKGVDGIKAILESGQTGMLFNRMDLAILRGVADAAHAQNLPLVIHTGDARDVADALSVGTNGIEHGSARDAIGDDLFARMKAQGVAYDPTLTVMEAFQGLSRLATDPLLDRPLVQQVGPASLLASTKAFLRSPDGEAMRQRLKTMNFSLDRASENLIRAWKSGVMLVTGSDAGNPLVWHGPTIHREMQLWVEAGIPPEVALQAATYNSAKLLRADDRIGLIKKGREATLMLIDGNPLKDIKLTENIQTLFFKGERIDRPELFDQH